MTTKLPSNVQYCRETGFMYQQIQASLLYIAERLFKIQQEKLWQGEHESYHDYLKSIDLKPGVASKLTTVYEQFVLNNGVSIDEAARIGYEKLYTAMPLLKSEEPSAVLVKAQEHSRDDLREEIRESEHGVCQHEDVETGYVRCKTCGKFFRQ